MITATPENYEAAVEYIERLPRFTRKHPLDHTKEFLKYLGNPAADKKVIHVAGTNGKGSVCAYIQAILAAEKKKCGFFTSPHLVKINERIQIDRKPVSDETFYEVFVKTRETVQALEEKGMEHPSYFEFLFGMAMMTFADTDVEYIILETGLGGRLDATNAVESPALTVITSVSLDHTDILGDTVEKVAFEKAGIIKPGIPVFYDGSDEKASGVIKKTAYEKQAPCREISNRAFKIQEVDVDHIAFSRQNAYDRNILWHVPICGIYQAMNAEIAIQAAEYLLKDESVCKERWVKAVGEVKWEGRMENAAPHLVVDGAHNPGALTAFVQSVTALHPEYEKEREEVLPVVVFSAVTDKKFEQMVQILCDGLKAKAYIVTEIDDPRKVPAKELAEIFSNYTDQPVYCKEETEDALKTAYKVRGEGKIYCIGSLYLAGQIKKYLSGGNDNVGF